LIMEGLWTAYRRYIEVEFKWGFLTSRGKVKMAVGIRIAVFRRERKPISQLTDNYIREIQIDFMLNTVLFGLEETIW
jgi:hypothetical protein